MQLEMGKSLRFVEDASPGDEAWPPDVDFILSALEAAGNNVHIDRRQAIRLPYRAVGHLKLYSALPDDPAITLYTRDVCPRGLGFVTQSRLPLGYGGILTLKGPDNQEMRLDVTLLRCREAVPGWFEGAVYFNRQQMIFSPSELRR